MLLALGWAGKYRQEAQGFKWGLSSQATGLSTTSQNIKKKIKQPVYTDWVAETGYKRHGHISKLKPKIKNWKPDLYRDPLTPPLSGSFQTLTWVSRLHRYVKKLLEGQCFIRLETAHLAMPGQLEGTERLFKGHLGQVLVAWPSGPSRINLMHSGSASSLNVVF